MVTTIGTEGNFETLLSDLIQLDYDAAEAYQVAIDRVENADFKASLLIFKQDHLRHIDDLSGALAKMGHEPPAGGDVKRMLTKGKVILGALAGDKAILQAMKTNEDDTNAAYERATGHHEAPPQIHAVFERNLQDERRHRDWMVEKIAQP
jgi:uncharacterized protein (TIGR02284 family)